MCTNSVKMWEYEKILHWKASAFYLQIGEQENYFIGMAGRDDLKIVVRFQWAELRVGRSGYFKKRGGGRGR